jgi:hypothetical protein
MADAKISDLASGSPPAAGDLMLIARSGASYYLSLANLFSRPLEIGANAPAAARFTKVGVGAAPATDYAYRAIDGFGTASQQVAFYTDINVGASAYAFYGGGTATSRLNGSMSIGGAAISGAVMTITAASTFAGADWQTATIGGGFYSSVTGPATMTTLLAGALVNVASAAAAYTLTNAVGYYASAFTKGAGSTITNVFGFYTDDTIAVGTNNYGYYVNITAASNTYAFYGAGTASSYFGGEMGIRTAVVTTTTLRLGAPSTTGADMVGGWSTYTGASTATASINGWASDLTTATAAYICGNVIHFVANATTKGAGSTITNVYGFYAKDSAIRTPAASTRAAGFYSDIADATATYQLYMGGTAASYFGGGVGILTAGVDPASGVLLRLGAGQTHPGTTTTVYAIRTNIVSPSTATASIKGHHQQLQSAAAAYTLGECVFFQAETFTKGAGSTVTNIYGVAVNNAVAQATNNYAYWTDFAHASGVWAIYVNGSARSYFGGTVGVLNNDPLGNNAIIRIGSTGTNHPATGSSIAGVDNVFAIPSTATTLAAGYGTNLRTAATAFTLTSMVHFYANIAVTGAGSTITNNYGFYASNNLAGAATNTYGFYSNINAASNTYQLYMAGTGSNHLNGLMGMFTSPTTSYGVIIAPTSLVTATAGYSLGLIGTAPATATTNYGALNIQVTGATATAHTNLFGIYISTLSFGGGGGSVTSGYGVRVDSFSAGSSGNYAFYTSMNTATGTFAFYADGTAASYFKGSVGIGGTAVTNTSTALGLTPTSTMSNATSQLVYALGSQVSATATLYAFRSDITSAASAYTVTNIVHYIALGATKGAGSTITNTYGFYAHNTSVQGTNNYGFYSNFAAASNTWALYLGGGARSYFGGPVGVMNASPDTAGAQLMVGGAHPSTATTVYAYLLDSTVPATCTAGYYGFYSTIQTVASAFAAGGVAHFRAANTTVGAGSSISTVYGFLVNSAAISGKATNNYGFYSDIASASNTYQLYMGGTAASYIARNLYIGSASTSTISQLYVGGTHPGTTTSPIGLNMTLVYPDTATANGYGVQLALATAAAVFTMSTLRMFEATQVTLGAGSAITTVYGFMARNAIAVGGTNIGFYSDINSATNTYQLYMGGTAASYFGTGANYFGSTTAAVADATARIQLNGATSNMIAWNTSGSAAPAFTTRSAGTKLVLYPNIGVATVDYAIGIEASNMWFSVQQQGAAVGWKFYGGTTLAMYISSAGFFEMYEAAAPSAGAANTARLFCRDNGSGKTQICAIFNTGAIQVIATEP